MSYFTKPAKTIDELYNILVDRKLEISNNKKNFITNFFNKENPEKEIKKDLEHI
jgi:hypothetical protein